MYLANSPADPKFIADELRVSQKSGAPSFALLDAAFEPPLGMRLDKAGALNLFDQTGLEGMKEVGPRLLSMKDVPHGWLLRDPQHLFEQAQNRPMLSFIQSSLETHELAHQLRRLTRAFTDEGNMEWPLRFADTRILPSLLKVMSADQMPLLHGIEQWAWPGRDGALEVWHVEGNAAPGPDRLNLSDAQFARMVQAAEADEALTTLNRAVPEALQEHAPHINHALVEQALECLRINGHDAAGLRLKVALAALTTNGGIKALPDMVEAICTMTDSAQLEERLDELLQAEEA